SFGLSSDYKEVPSRDSALVKYFRDKGAFLLGTTNLDPACLDSLGSNPYHGDVENPLRKDLLCGGSSSGSAAAVARDYCDFALGSDMAGSIRIPAACCGVVGYKASTDFLPLHGALSLGGSLDSAGVLCSSLEDLEVLLGISAEEDLSWKYIPPEMLGGMDALIRERYSHFMQHMRTLISLSAINESIGFKEAWEIRKDLIASAAKEFFISHPSRVFPEAAKALLEYDRRGSDERKDEVKRRVEFLIAHYESLIGEKEVLITPTLPCLPPVKGEELSGDFESSFGRFLVLANVLGAPALTVPLPCDSGEFPISVQFLARPGSDKILIGAVTKLMKRCLSDKVF
ncbi:MAG: amidase, partial [Bdellovibrionales bacterium]|nr:amidase [Bdellovibrionales bacterium]